MSRGGPVARAVASASSSSSSSLPFCERLVCGGGNVVAFVALIGLAARVQFPIDSMPSVAMVLLGVLALAAGVLAFCTAGRGGSGGGGSGRGTEDDDGGGGGPCRCAASTFVALQLIGVMLQALLTLLLFVRLDEAVRMVLASASASASAAPADGVHEAAAAAQAAGAARALVVARWVELCLLLPVQSAALALGMAKTCCGFKGFGGGGGDEGGASSATALDQGKLLSLAALRGATSSFGGGGGVASGLSAAALGVGAMYERTRGALVTKYGKALAAKPPFWRRFGR